MNQECPCQDLEAKESEKARSKWLGRTQVHECQRQLEKTESDREKRLARMREYGRQRCQNESEEMRAERLAKMRVREHQRRLEESEEDRAKRLAKMRAYQHQRRQGKQTRQSAELLECKHEQDVSHANNSVQLPIPNTDGEEDKQGMLVPRALQNGQDVLHFDMSEKEDQLDGAQYERAKRLARMRTYEKQRRQEETDEDRAVRLAKMRAREHQRRLVETEEERAKRLARMRARRRQAKELEGILESYQEQAWNISHANTSVQVLGEKEDHKEELQGSPSVQLAVNERQHQQGDRTEQHRQDDSTGQVPIPRMDEGDTPGRLLTCEHPHGHDMLNADSSGQSRTVKEGGELEGDCRAICYYSYCDL